MAPSFQYPGISSLSSRNLGTLGVKGISVAWLRFSTVIAKATHGNGTILSGDLTIARAVAMHSGPNWGLFIAQPSCSLEHDNDQQE
jgi:hypothetical protein